ncbi:hypothetical protein K8R43_02280 [archaeon]|nr:hypothetical protein [archaeon]
MKYSFLLAIILLASASALDINFEEPTGEYAYGTIPVIVQLIDNTTEIQDAELTAELREGNVVIETKELVKGNTYTCSFEIKEAGSYTVKVYAEYNGSDYENSSSFKVTTSKLFLEITSPENKTYASSPDIKASVKAAGKFVHDAQVTAKINSDDTEIELTVPEGRSYYRAETELGPGYYQIIVTAEKDEQTVQETVDFTITGEINGVFIPGEQKMEIKRAAPVKSKYSVGSKTDINILLVNTATGEKLRKSNAIVEARVITPSIIKEIRLAYKDDQVNPMYTTPLLLDEKGWYEILVTASLEGYSNTSTVFPAIKAGEEVVPLPEAMGCANGFCMKIHAPDFGQTFPVNDTVSLKVQVLEDTNEHPPISDAEVIASTDSDSTTLEYEKNGYYSGEIGPLKEGGHEVTFTATWKDQLNSNSTSFYVSPSRLMIKLVYPMSGDNITEEYITVQVQVLDESGETVAGANARANIETPSKAVHNIDLARNAETGYYESSFTFTDAGVYSVKVIASEQGYVSNSKEFEFTHWKEEAQPLSLGDDWLLIVLIIGIAVVALAIWKAFL